MVVNAASMWRFFIEGYAVIGATTRQYCKNVLSTDLLRLASTCYFSTDICIRPHLDRHESQNQQVGIGFRHQAMQRNQVTLTKEQYEEIKQGLVACRCSLQPTCDVVFQRIVAVEVSKWQPVYVGMSC